MSNDTGKTMLALVGGAVAGAAIGVAIGMLLAPDKGEHTRDRVKEKLQDFEGDLMDKVDEILDKVVSKADDLVNKSEEIANDNAVEEEPETAK